MKREKVRFYGLFDCTRSLLLSEFVSHIENESLIFCLRHQMGTKFVRSVTLPFFLPQVTTNMIHPIACRFLCCCLFSLCS